LLNALIRLAVQRRAAAIVTTLFIFAYGLHAWNQTPIEAFPDVTNAQVTVIAQLPGYAPEEIERRVTVPLERSLNGTPGMTMLRSESLFGLSLVTLTFDDDADPFIARTMVWQRIAGADLPDEVVPELSPEATPLGEVYQFRLASDRHDVYALRSELEWRVAPYLKQVPGVAEVVAFGGFLKELHIEADPGAMDALGVTLEDVVATVEGSNLNVGGGFLVHGAQELVIRSIGDETGAESLKSLVITANDRFPVVLGDVARVVSSHTPRRGTVGQDLDLDIVEGFVIMRRGENPSVVLDAVKARIVELDERILPEGMRIEVFYDRSTLVDLTLDTTYHNLAHGFILIVAVVWLFLRSLSGTIAVAVIIPLSLVSAFIGLSFLGLPANLISMGAIDFGILVDGAVVLVEAVLHELQHHPAKTKREIFQRVIRGSLSVVKPTFYAMAIILASLLPIFALEQVEGRIFRPLALTYAFALVGALVFALTVVPAILAVMLRANRRPAATPKTLVWLTERYRRSLAWLLPRRWVAAALAGGLIAVGWASVSTLGTEFLPELDEGDLVIFVEMPPSIDLSTSQALLLETRRRLLVFPEVISTLSEHGRPEDGTDNEGVNMSETFVRLRPTSEWRPGLDKDGLIDAMRLSLTQIPGVRFNFSQPIKDNIEEAISGVRGKVVLKVYGSDLDAMRKGLEQARDELSKIEGIVDLDLYRDAQIPQLRIALDRRELAREGIRVFDAQTAIEVALAGRVTTEMWVEERPVPVRVRLASESRGDLESIGRIPLRGAGEATIPLADVAGISLAEGRASINREQGSRFLALKFNVTGRDLGSVVNEAIAAVEAAVKPPPGAWFEWGGEFENQARAVQRLQVVVPLALLVVLALLYQALQSARSAFAILFMAPFALTGGAVGLMAMDIPLSVSAAVGFIALLGQVSLMGLLVVSAIEDRRREGEARRSAVVEGAAQRLRPLLMAALLGIMGLIPMVLATGVGSETSRPFAVVIVFGLITTLVVSLWVLPVVHELIAADPKPDGAELDDEPEVATTRADANAGGHS